MCKLLFCRDVTDRVSNGWRCFKLFTFRGVRVFLLRNIILVVVCWGRRWLLFCFLLFFGVHTTIMISVLKIAFWWTLWGLRCSKSKLQNSELEKLSQRSVHSSPASSLPQGECTNWELGTPFTGLISPKDTKRRQAMAGTALDTSADVPKCRTCQNASAELSWETRCSDIFRAGAGREQTDQRPTRGTPVWYQFRAGTRQSVCRC